MQTPSAFPILPIRNVSQTPSNRRLHNRTMGVAIALGAVGASISYAGLTTPLDFYFEMVSINEIRLHQMV